MVGYRICAADAATGILPVPVEVEQGDQQLAVCCRRGSRAADATGQQDPHLGKNPVARAGHVPTLGMLVEITVLLHVVFSGYMISKKVVGPGLAKVL